VRYKLDANALEIDSTEGKSHGSTLERLLAWEKKLYEEVKVISPSIPWTSEAPLVNDRTMFECVEDVS
jgi:hypothetical protein